MLEFIHTLAIDSISSDRKELLDHLAGAINQSYQSYGTVKLNFICTHNSRRSIFSQVWAAVLAEEKKLKAVDVYSGGTEVTRVFQQVVDTLKHHGLELSREGLNDNPIYHLKTPIDKKDIPLFSKVYDDEVNPSENFIAIMTCNSADADCPFIPGAFKRISLPFEDPKFSDGTPEMSEAYRLTSIEIATELLYVFSKVKPI